MDAISAPETPPTHQPRLQAEPSIPEGSPGAILEAIDVMESPLIRTKLRLYAILSGLYLALFISALDQTIVANAIPTMSAELHSATGYVWIGSAYVLASAATGPIWAKCSDIWGRKLVVLIAVGIFAGSSLIAALSANMTMLIAGRALQGLGDGGIMQLVAITISDLFSVRERSLYLGFVGFVWALAGSAGPLVGGSLTQYASWRWCFWINLPITGITFVLLLVFLDVHNPRTRLMDGVRAIDWVGMFSILAIALLILLGLDFGGAIFPWNSPKVICLLVVGTLMIGFFIFTEKRLAKYPLMPMGVFKHWSNKATFLVATSHGMIVIAMDYYLPLFFQSVKQASPMRSGVLMLPLILTQAIIEILAGFVIHKTGRYREFIWAGTTLMTLGIGLYINFGTNTSIATIVGLEMFGALGPALLFQGPTVAIQNTVDQAETAAAIASLGFIRSVAMSLSLVVGGVVFQNSMDSKQSSFAAAGLSESAREALSGSQAAANVGITGSIQDVAQQHVVLEAFAWSMRNMFIMYTCLAAVAMIASAFIIHRDLRTEHTETKTGIQNLTKRANTSG